MLVLSRQINETIMIGDDIELSVVDVKGDKVRLGIKAPPHVAVHRKEVYEAIRRENSRRESENQYSSGQDVERQQSYDAAGERAYRDPTTETGTPLAQ